MEPGERTDAPLPDYDTLLSTTLDRYRELLVDHLKLQEAAKAAVDAWKNQTPTDIQMAQLMELV